MKSLARPERLELPTLGFEDRLRPLSNLTYLSWSRTGTPPKFVRTLGPNLGKVVDRSFGYLFADVRALGFTDRRVGQFGEDWRQKVEV